MNISLFQKKKNQTIIKLNNNNDVAKISTTKKYTQLRQTYPVIRVKEQKYTI